MGRIGDVGSADRARRVPPVAQRATVRGIDSASGWAMVTIDRVSRQVLRGPCPWMRQVDEAGVPISPEPGDLAWVVESDAEPVIVCWWPQ